MGVDTTSGAPRSTGAAAGTLPVLAPLRGDKRRLVLLSFLMLFVELALIRWTGSNVVYLSYFSNFVLLGSFLGIGIGFLRARARTDLFFFAPTALVVLVAFVLTFPVEINRRGEELIYFGSTAATGLPPWLTLPVVFLAVATLLMMVTEGVARVFVRFPPLQAYRLDVTGSLLGIVGFSVLAFFRAPPVIWGVVVAAVFLYVMPPRARVLQAVPLLLLVGLLGWESVQANESWSPYYRVTAVDGDDFGEPYTVVSVNGIPHQEIQSSDRRQEREPIYFDVYERIGDNPLRDVLVVGAGNGSDVAIALEHGAQHVDAVEIDPRLYELGLEKHPDRPYQDPRVDVHIDDGRAFLERVDRQYDLIVFALPDSLTLVSGQSSLRLESYLFTLEAMREARAHLAPGGAFAMYNYYREDWLIDRLAATLSAAHGRPPCVDRVEGSAGLALLVASPDPSALSCQQVWAPLTASAPPPVDDDYPFLYLREPGIPRLYLLTLGLILLASVMFVRAAAGPLRQMSPYIDLFFMGAAFLLLETKSVVQFALLFGTTWFVNALVFAGVLVAVLAAIEVAERVTFRRPALLYAALLAALAVAWMIPQAMLLNLPTGVRFVAAVVVAFTPIFLANLVFADRFKQAGSSAIAFGANLLGAMIGGVLEYAALLVGYRALLVVTALLYGLAFVFVRRHLPARAAIG